MADLFNEFDSLIKQEKQATNTNMNFNVGSAANANPEQEVFFKDLSKRTGLPVESLRLDGGKEAKRQALLAEAEMIPSHAPATGTWLARSDGTKVAIAADSFDELAGMERLLHPKSKGGSTLGIASPQDQDFASGVRKNLSTIPKSFEAGQQQSEMGRLGWRRVSGDKSKETAERILQLGSQIEEVTKQADEQGGFIGSILSPTAKIMGQMWSSIPNAATRGLQGASAGAAAGAIASTPTAGIAAPITAGGGALIGFTAGFGAGLAEDMMIQEGGAAYNELKELRGKNGEQIDETTAQMAAMGVGTVNGLLELVGLNILTAPARKFISVGVKKAAQEEIEKALVRPTVGAAFRKGGMAYATSVGGEVVTEVAQEVTNIVAEEISKAATPGEFDPVKMEQVGKRLYSIASETFRGTLLLGLPGAGGTFAGHYRAAQKAESNQQFFDTLNDQVKNGKLQKRDVETFEDFVAHVANEQGGIDEVRVPAEQWAEYWQSAGIDPVSIAVEVIGEEGAVQFQEALATGGDVVIPFEKFAGRIVGTDHYEGLKQDLRFGDSWTVREAQYFEQNKDALLDEAMAEHERIMNDPVEASSQSVYENIYGQLSQIMPQDQAHLQAVMASENIRSRAARLGVDPLALYNERPISVGREFADGGGQVLGQGGNTTTIYHGTTKEAAELIEQNGFDVSMSADGTVWFTSNPEIGDVAATGSGGIVSRVIDENQLKLGGWDETDKYSTEELVAMGYDGLKLVDDGETTYQIFNPEKLAKIGKSLSQSPAPFGGNYSPTTTGIADSYLSVRDSRLRAAGFDVDTYTMPHPLAEKVLVSISQVSKDGKPVMLVSRSMAGRSVYLDNVISLLGEDERTGVLRPLYQAESDIAKRYGLTISSDLVNDNTKRLFEEFYPQFSITENGRHEATHEKQQTTIIGQGTSQRLQGFKEFARQDELNFFKSAFPAGSGGLADLRSRSVGNTLFQSNNNTPRGKVELRPDAFNITLLQNADLTTFTHELGHTWLEQLRADALRADAPEQIKQDWQTIKEWAGIADDAGQIQTEAHETFARGIEAYLMEGKAPSSKLDEVFARVAEWMKLVYKSLSTLNVELNDEVRAVFDRMLASDEEIKAARQRQQYKPLFATAEEAGMTPEQFDLYVKQNGKAMDAAEKRMRDRLMKQITRERETWWRLELARIKEEVRKEAQEMPVYQATQLLTKGEDFDGNKPDVPVKLDKDTLVKLYGEDYLKKLPRGFGYAYTTQNGAHPDDVAALFGYASGDEMLQAVTEAPRLKDYVKQEAERRMQEKHNDLPPIAELADEAVHNDLQAEVLRNEMRILSKAKKQGDAAVRVSDKADRVARNEAMDTIPSLEMFRLAAAQAINSKTLREIKPHLYLSAEQKAGRKAFDMAAKGKYPEAAEAKRQQILNHFLYRESLKAQEFADKVYNYTNRMQKKPAQERLGKAQGGYLEQFNGLLEKYEFKQVSDKEIDRRQASLLEWSNRMSDQGEEVAISEDILLDQPRNYRMLTMQELQGLYDALKNIDHLAKMQLEMIVDGQMMAYDDAAAMLIGAAETNYKRKALPIDKETQSWIEKQAEKLQTFDASLIKVEQLFTWLDGGRIDGPWQTLIFRQLSKSQTDEMDLSVEYAQKIYDLFDQYTKFQGSGWEGSGMMAKRHFKSIRQDLTKQATLAVALNTGNEGNYQRLLDGYGWNEDQLTDILNTLTAEDWQFVQKVWNTIDEMWPRIEQLDKDLTGVAPEKIQPREFTNDFGTFKGGYYPAVGDSRMSETGERQLDAKGDRLFGGNYVRATTEKGHTKARVASASYPILLNLEVIPQHMAQVMHDLAYRRSVLQVNKLINRKDVASAIKETMGVPYHRLLNKWLANVANDANIDRTGADFWTRFMAKLRTNSQIVSMGFKASTMTSQISGFLTSLDLVKPQYLMHAVQQTMRNPLAMTRAVREKSGEMRHRANMLDRDVRDGVRKAMGKKGSWAGMQAMAFHGIAIADAMVTVPTWWGAYQQGLAEGLDETDATAFADRAVRLSQGAGGAKDLSAVQQKSEFTKLITMFYSYFNVLYSRFRDMGVTAEITPAGFATIAWRSLILWIIPAVLSEMLAGRMPPDDDDEKQQWFAKKTLAYPFMVIPFVRDVVNSIESGRDYTLSPITTVGQKIVKLAKQADDISSGTVESDKLLLDIIDVFGYSVGAPTGQAKITGRYLWEVWQGDADPENAAQFMHDLIFTRERKK